MRFKSYLDIVMIYSAFTYFTESFSLNSSKTTERMVIKLCMRQSFAKKPFLKIHIEPLHRDYSSHSAHPHRGQLAARRAFIRIQQQLKISERAVLVVSFVPKAVCT